MRSDTVSAHGCHHSGGRGEAGWWGGPEACSIPNHGLHLNLALDPDGVSHSSEPLTVVRFKWATVSFM